MTASEDQWVMPPIEIFGINAATATTEKLAWRNDVKPELRRAFIQLDDRVLVEGTPAELRTYFESALERLAEIEQICEMVPPARRLHDTARGLER